MEKQYILINANGAIANQTGSYHIDLIALITDSGCNIEKVNFDRTFNILSGSILLSGKWNEIALLEKKIEKFLENQDVNLDIIRPNVLAKSEDKKEFKNKNEEILGYIPYEIQVVNIDESGIISKFVDFFAYQEVDIEKLDAKVYKSEYGANLIRLNIKVKVPSNLNIASLREQFDIMCYDESFDATFKVYSVSS